jgi:phosphoglycolate phosphatase
MKLIIFDWDGTIMNSVSHIVHCIQLSADDLGEAVPNDEQVKNIIGLGMFELIDVLFNRQDEEFHQQLIARYRHHFYNNTENPSVFFPRALETLQQLKSDGYMLAVATSKSRAGLDHVFEKYQLNGFFDDSKCADESASKPNPLMLNKILAKLNIDVEQSLMIGDTEYDMEMAQNCGMAGLGVSYGAHSKERLQKYGILDCLDEILQLPNWLNLRRK